MAAPIKEFAMRCIVVIPAASLTMRDEAYYSPGRPAAGTSALENTARA
jgi:hypothetical protein